MTERKPIVIGAGGLLDKDENGRVTDILTKMREHGCLTYEIRISKICRNGDTIVCPVSLDSWALDADSTVKTALQDPQADVMKVGLVGSSLGVTLLDHYLAGSETLTGRGIPYVAIVPFAKVHSDRRPQLEAARNLQRDIPIGSEFDAQKGIKRIIPYSDITEILSIDTPELLKRLGSGYRISPFTIYGKEDDRVDVESILRRHAVLGGKPEDLRGFPCKHNTDPQSDINLATEYLKEHLLAAQ